MDTADEKITRRSAVESEYNGAREGIERQYIEDKKALEEAYHTAIRENRESREAALVAAGLNPDGSDPQER